MISIFLCLALLYLIITSVIFGINLYDFTPLLPADSTPADSPPLVSICIPARNEEGTIKRSLTSALSQTYPFIEVLVLDDQSTDQTPDILTKLKKLHPQKLLIIDGKNKPANWLGKAWACHQLGKKANGQILFFIDADVWLKPQAVARAVHSLKKYSLDFITIWPMQQLGSLAEKLVIPLVYYGLFSLLPARYVYKKPWWLSSSLNKQFGPKFAAACGQCMIFRREAYQQIGGHQAVKNNIVEDVALAKRIKQQGLSMRMFHGRGTVWCRMYTSGRAMWQGFRKNFLALFGDNVPLFILMGIINFIVYVLPVFSLAAGLLSANPSWIALSLCALALSILHRLVLAGWYHWSLWIAFLHPLGVLWFMALALQVVRDRIKGERARWKDRSTS